MKDICAVALGRALAFCGEILDISLDGFFSRAAWELYHQCSNEFASVAFVVRGEDGVSLVGKPGDVETLPLEALHSFLVTSQEEPGQYRVRDHALDTIRFIDANFRTSIVVPVGVPSSLLSGARAILWCGLDGCATRKKIELARLVAEASTEWLKVYSPALKALQSCSRRAADLQARLEEMTGVAHDTRAPLGALKYLMAEVAGGQPELSGDFKRVGEELAYVERLMGVFSPRRTGFGSDGGSVCDASEVLRRVSDRFLPEIQSKGGVLKRGLLYEPCWVRMPALDLERVCSNIVGNAARYADRGAVVVEIEERENREVVLRVSDAGPGLPRDVIERLACSDGPTVPVLGANGWGVGLLSSRQVVEAHGGRLVVASAHKGTTIEVLLARVDGCVVARPTERGVREAGVQHVYHASECELVVIDDDAGHSASLERVLAREGVPTKTFDSVEAALRMLEESDDRSVRIVCDAHMPDGGAERLLRRLRQRDPLPSVAVISGEDDDESLYRYAALGAREFFLKPVDIDRLLSWMRAS